MTPTTSTFRTVFPLGDRHRVIWGLGYRFTHDAVVAAPLVAFVPPQLDRNLASGFVQDEIKLHEKLLLTLGTKLEHNDYTGLELEPGGRLQWNFLERQMVWAAVSRAVRTPSRYDADLREFAAPNLVLLSGGGGLFRSETVIAYELGYRAQFGSKVDASISAFYNDYDHLRSVGLSPVTLLPLTFENSLVAQTYGFEFAGNYQALPWWRWHFSYNLLDEHIHDRNGVNFFTSDFFQAHNETADPQQQLQLRWSVDVTRDIDFNAALRWTDKIQVNSGSAVAAVPSYFEADARLAWRPAKQWEISLVGQNLLHNRHVEYGFPGPGQEAIGRSVYGKMSFYW